MNQIVTQMTKKWWFWLAIVIAIVLAWQILSGWAYSRKLYNMALDNLREDQSKIIEIKNEWIAQCEKEITELNKQMEIIQREKNNLQGEKNKLYAEREILKGRIFDLENRRQTIIISDDPDRIIDDLRTMGIRSIRRR